MTDEMKTRYSYTRNARKAVVAVCIMFGFGSGTATYAQNVGIGSSEFVPNADALLELRSTNSGLLLPRMTMGQRDAIASPTESLIIYQVDSDTGFYYFDGTMWVPFINEDLVVESIDNLGNHTAEEDIVLAGNAIVNTPGNPGIVVNDLGYIGAGTDSPISPIHAVGTPITPFEGTTNGIMTLESEYLQNYYAPFDFVPSNTGLPMARIAAMMTASGSSLHLGTSNNYASGITNTAISIMPNGNVGIGTADAKSSLEIEDGDLFMSNSAGTASGIRMQGTGEGSTSFKAGDQGASNIQYVLPEQQGSANTVLSNDGTGNLDWMKITALLSAVTQAVNGNGVSQSSNVDTYADLAQMSLPVQEGTYIVFFNAQFTMSTGNTVGEFAVSIDGVVTETIRQVMAPSNNAPGNISIMSVIQVPSATDAKILFRRVVGGTCSVSGRTLIAVKII